MTSIRDLPENTELWTQTCDKIAGREFYGCVRIGTVNPKTGAVKVFLKRYRTATPQELEAGIENFYGLVDDWKPLDVNGEDVMSLDRLLGLNPEEDQP